MPPVPRSAGGVSSCELDPLDALLRDLGPHLRRGEAPAEPLTPCPTGIAEVDRALGGGFPRGRLGEVSGPASSGRTSLALHLLATTTRAQEFVAVVDACDAFDPASAEAAGVDLARMLWVRAPNRKAALRSAERLLEARGFALVLLDLADDPGPARPLPRSTWPRLVRSAAASVTSLVVLGSTRVMGTYSSLSIELDTAQACFTGTPLLLEGLEGRLLLARNRQGASHHQAMFRLAAA